MKSQTITFLAALCICSTSAFTANAWSPPEPPPDEDLSCTNDADCGEDEYCAFGAPLICEIEADTGECLPPDEDQLLGFCSPLEEPLEDECESDSDCGPGYYCELLEAGCAIDCASEEDCTFQCDEPDFNIGVCQEYDIVHDTNCYDSSDCEPGFRCEYVEPAWFSDGDAEEDYPPPGICVNEVVEGECASDAECGEGYRCEFVGTTCAFASEDGQEWEEDCDYQESFGYCVGIDVHPGDTTCNQDSDCYPDESCSPEGYCEYIWVVPPPHDESCFFDEDCGEGGVCVNAPIDCADGADCMMPAVEGQCQYDLVPVEEPECIVTVYGMCVVYADENTEVSCDASSGAPTWLAFLAIFGLIRRRTDRK
jgi:hypothetical protein